MKNLKSYEVKYLGATNTLGSRVKIIDHLKQCSKTIDFGYEFSNTLDVAVDFLKRNGVDVVATSELKNSYIILTDTFDLDIRKFAE
jgi:hypothetical protein